MLLTTLQLGENRMKIEKIYTDRLRNATHFQFHTEFRDLVIRTGAETLKVKPQFDTYLLLYKNVDDGLKKISKSTITDKITELDKIRDGLWSGLTEINRGFTKHFNPNIKEAAKRLQVVFNTYGNLAILSLNDQTALTYNILKELEENYAEDIETLGIIEWITELKSKNIELGNLFKERADEATAKHSIVLKEARIKLDNIYQVIIERIYAFSIVAEDPGVYETFIKTWNYFVVKFNGNKRTISDSDEPVIPPTETINPTEPQEPEDPFANAREWKHSVKAGDFKLGDICYIAEPNVPKKYYELIDEEHYIYFPNSDEGTLAWKRLV